MPTVYLGNTSVVVPFGEAQAVVHGSDDAPPVPQQSVHAPELGQQVTTISLPEGGGLAEVVSTWSAHSASDPAWVESDDDALADQVASHYSIPVGCPDGDHDAWKAI